MNQHFSKKVAAIVCAYNEAPRITRVLKTLLASPYVSEVIVVDDGSVDGTAQVAALKGVRVLVNSVNKGKAYSMQRGVEATDAEVLFFADADLRGLTPEMVSSMITPVLLGHYAMFIGLRNRVSERSISLFSVNSGERAVMRTLWEAVPLQFKRQYRIEAGLNLIAKQQFGGFGSKVFNYNQTAKEKKYGVVRGTFLRCKMATDVAYAYVLHVPELVRRDSLAR